MISKETFDKIQEYKEIGFSVLRVSKKLGISYNTAYNWWNKTEADYNAKQREHEPVLDNYRQFVIELLKICPQMNNTLILKRVRESFPEFDVPDASFFRYVKKLRDQTGLQKPKRRGAIRDEVQPGYEGQVDFGQYVMKNMYGVNTRIYFFCMVLSYSRMKFAYFSSEPFDAKKTIEAHKYAFRYFGGRPQMLVYDQDKTIVISENMGNVIFVKEFEDYINDTGFSIYLCKGYDPQTKGRVEKVVDRVKHDFLDGRIFCGIDCLNNACLDWLDGIGNGQVNACTKKTPREMFREDSRHLIKVHEKRDTDVTVLTPRDTVIEYMGNHYKLPEKYVPDDERVRVERIEKTMLVFQALTNDLICRFEIPDGVGKVVSAGGEAKTPSLETEMLEEFAGDETATAFLKGLRKEHPRYMFPQCSRLRKMQKFYTDEQLHTGMSHCCRADKCDMNELTAYMLYHYGEETVRKYVDMRLFKSYLKRSFEIKEEYENG